MEFYCIQRGIFRDKENENCVGIDRFVQLLEMFYAEYEFGALPRALKSMTKDFDNMEFFTFTFKRCKKRPEKKTIKILANIKENGRKEEIIKHIQDIGTRQKSTKGYSWFPGFLEEKEFDKIIMSNFWWSIDDDVMFFVDDEDNTNEEKLKTTFANLKVKWADELFPPTPKNKFIEKITSIFSKKKVV